LSAVAVVDEPTLAVEVPVILSADPSGSEEFPGDAMRPESVVVLVDQHCEIVEDLVCPADLVDDVPAHRNGEHRGALVVRVAIVEADLGHAVRECGDDFPPVPERLLDLALIHCLRIGGRLVRGHGVVLPAEGTCVSPRHTHNSTPAQKRTQRDPLGIPNRLALKFVNKRAHQPTGRERLHIQYLRQSE